MAFQTAYLFRFPHNYFFYGFVFSGTVCSYNLHWALTPKLFKNPMLPATGLNRIPVRMHIALSIAGFVCAIILFVLLRHYWLWLAAAGVISFLYTAPKLPWRITRFLQKIAYGKTIFLTLAWTYITAVLPFLVTKTPIEEAQILFCVNRFFLIYAICILFDLRDRDSDRQEGIKSMITEYTHAAVDRIYIGVMTVFFVTSLLLAFYFPLRAIIAINIPGMFLLFGYSWFKKQRSDFVYNFMLDGLMIFSLPLLLLFGF